MQPLTDANVRAGVRATGRGKPLRPPGRRAPHAALARAPLATRAAAPAYFLAQP